MNNYKSITNMLVDGHFISQNKNQIQLGKRILDSMLYKIIAVKLTDQKGYQLLKDSISNIIIKQVGISNQEHLLMCIGSIGKNGEYQKLKPIEIEIEKCIEAKNLSQPIPQSAILNKTHDLSIDTKFSGARLQFCKPGEPSFESNGNQKEKQQISRIQNQQINEQLEDDDYDIMTQLQNMSKLSISSQKSKKSSQSENNLPLVEMPRSVQQYLMTQVKSHMSQLNTLVQKLKLQTGDWTQQNRNGDAYQSYYVIIPQILGMGMAKKVQAQAIESNKKKAKQKVALKILRTVYENYPHLFYKILQIKAKEAIKT